MGSDPSNCAQEILEVVPLVMAAIREEMRRHRGAGLSVPQFRTLVFLSRRPGASLSIVADHLGLTLPSVSRLVDGLVTRGLTRREVDPRDRRRVTLSLTGRGAAAFRRAQEATRTEIAGRLDGLTGPERKLVAQAMRTLQPVIGSARRPGRGKDGGRG